VHYLCELELIPVAITKADEVASGIRRARGNVLVLIRGGGDPAEFDVFDQKLVVETWGLKPAFKALGLGHEGTARTLLDFISDYVGSTPTAVGGFLAQQIATLEQRSQVALTAQEQRAQLEKQNRSLRAELARAEERQAAVSKAADEAAAHKRKRI
jgi:exonuclease VII large subunit